MPMRLGRWLSAALACCLLALPCWAADAAGLQAVPALRAHVMDETGTLSAADTAALEQQLAGFERERGAQIVVLLVATTAPEDIADYSQRVAEAWKLGRAGVGDGLLLVAALQDRRVRIAPYKTLEGAIPDALAKRIIDQQIVPAFRRGDYAAGLRDALTQLQARITGEALPEPAAASSRPQTDEFDLVEAAMLLLVAVPLVTGVLRQLLGQRLGALAGAAAASLLVWQITQRTWMALLAGLIGFFGGLLSRGLPVSGRRHGGGWGGTPGGGWGDGGGGFGGSGFGGGMSSGGGGDAGGGGASGSW
ncbi:MAG: TPM domain-containing protein [Limnohabitans sp.]